MENKLHSNPSTADDIKDSNCRPGSHCPNDASNISEEVQSDIKPLQNLVLSKAYRPVAAKILQQWDLESFLACRLVCKDWREMVNLHRPKWKVLVLVGSVQLSTTLHDQDIWKLLRCCCLLELMSMPLGKQANRVDKQHSILHQNEDTWVWSRLCCLQKQISTSKNPLFKLLQHAWQRRG